MKTTLYITRHGETLWNLEKRMQGWMDSPLSDLGKLQAEWLGERLKKTEFGAVYASSSERAYKTAQIVCAGKNIEIFKTENLREIGLGDWEGRNAEEIEKFEGEQFYNFFNAPHLFKRSLGETFVQVKERAVEEIKRIISKHEGTNILIVTHACTLKVLMSYFGNIPLDKLWDPPYIHQTCLCVVKIEDEKFNIVLNGDISHYKKIE